MLKWLQFKRAHQKPKIKKKWVKYYIYYIYCLDQMEKKPERFQNSKNVENNTFILRIYNDIALTLIRIICMWNFIENAST